MTDSAMAERHAHPTYMTDASRWGAVLGRDRQADGVFWYGVMTTGVYCRPHCPSRPARRENVRFFCTREEARAAGLRACKRCRPDEDGMEAAQTEAVRRACRLIEEAEETPGLERLAKAARLSPFHFHRIFKTVTGVTPKQYANAHRARRISEGLAQASSVTAAIYEGGYNSPSRFYEKSGAMLGMMPSTYRQGGTGEAIRYAIVPCSLGLLLVAATVKGICAIRFGDDAEALRAELTGRFPRATITEGDAEFEATVHATIAYIEEPGDRFRLPLDIRGTAFQQRVWQALQQIPKGQTASYRAIAETIGNPAAVRAVAGACAANPLAVAVPCHRVVRADGDLAGYRWGPERKEALLKREGAR